jgi:thiamine pyrophosphokinase
MSGPYVVVAGGDPIDVCALDDIPAGATVIAADSGADHAAAIGLTVDLLVGDLDSISAAGLSSTEQAGTPIDRHPAAKDQTDLELALRTAVESGASEIVVIGGHGGRVDHFLGNALLLAAPAFAAADVRAVFGSARVWVVRCRTALTGEPGELLSLLAVHGPATGVTTEGLEWPLRDEILHPGSSRGVSNVFTQPVAHVQVRSGVLLAVAPRVPPT